MEDEAVVDACESAAAQLEAQELDGERLETQLAELVPRMGGSLKVLKKSLTCSVLNLSRSFRVQKVWTRFGCGGEHFGYFRMHFVCCGRFESRLSRGRQVLVSTSVRPTGYVLCCAVAHSGRITLTPSPWGAAGARRVRYGRLGQSDKYSTVALFETTARTKRFRFMARTDVTL